MGKAVTVAVPPFSGATDTTGATRPGRTGWTYRVQVLFPDGETLYLSRKSGSYGLSTAYRDCCTTEYHDTANRMREEAARVMGPRFGHNARVLILMEAKNG
jgi:hypothetical protein